LRPCDLADLTPYQLDACHDFVVANTSRKGVAGGGP
jgi:hypothetical protein